MATNNYLKALKTCLLCKMMLVVSPQDLGGTKSWDSNQVTVLGMNFLLKSNENVAGYTQQLCHYCHSGHILLGIQYCNSKLHGYVILRMTSPL